MFIRIPAPQKYDSLTDMIPSSITLHKFKLLVLFFVETFNQ